MAIKLASEAEFTSQRPNVWILILLLGLVMLYTVIMFFVTMRMRIKAFGPKFMEQFNKEH